MIKSHLPAELVPLDSPAKFVAVTRDPLDCAASGFHFYSSLLLGPAAPPPDVWLDFFASDKTFYGPWHQFTATWWAARDRDNVLFLRFEDLKSDTEDTVRKIAAFLDIDLSPDQSCGFLTARLSRPCTRSTTDSLRSARTFGATRNQDHSKRAQSAMVAGCFPTRRSRGFATRRAQGWSAYAVIFRIMTSCRFDDRRQAFVQRAIMVQSR